MVSTATANARPATAAPASSSPAHWSTPRTLQAALGGMWLGALLLFATMFIGTREVHNAVQTVGKDTAPSIIAAQRLKAYLADMDANLANELIGRPGENTAAVQEYLDRQQKAAGELVNAAKNITYGDKELQPILGMQQGLVDFTTSATRARVLHERGDAAMLPAYRHATELMHASLIPNADRLDQANSDAMNTIYGQQQEMATAAITFVALWGLALLGVLLATQMYLNRRMRRTFNPPLLAASVLAALLAAYGILQFSGAMGRVRAAKQDAFDSIHALLQAKADSYDANGEESRWLLDRQNAAAYDTAFRQKCAKLVSLSDPQAIDQAAVRAETGAPADNYRGYLASELNNITFAGEREAAVQSLRTFGAYYAMDEKIRALENSGRHQDAVELCIGSKPGQSNYAFAQFDNAVEQTIDINQSQFDKDIDEGFARVAAVPYIGFFGCLVVAGLAFAGVNPRLREYAV